jgi:Protein of unknown function (DUF2934)
MSRRAAEFLDEWLGENAVTPVAGATDSETRLRVDECLRAAKDEGIAPEDLEEEVGDLSAYMTGVVTDLIAAPSSTKDLNREQRIRTKAFSIWLDEGCPEGRAEIHWDMATELVVAEDAQSTLKSTEGDPVEPLSVVKKEFRT